MHLAVDLTKLLSLRLVNAPNPEGRIVKTIAPNVYMVNITSEWRLTPSVMLHDHWGEVILCYFAPW